MLFRKIETKYDAQKRLTETIYYKRYNENEDWSLFRTETTEYDSEDIDTKRTCINKDYCTDGTIRQTEAIYDPIKGQQSTNIYMIIPAEIEASNIEGIEEPIIVNNYKKILIDRYHIIYKYFTNRNGNKISRVVEEWSSSNSYPNITSTYNEYGELLESIRTEGDNSYKVINERNEFGNVIKCRNYTNDVCTFEEDAEYKYDENGNILSSVIFSHDNEI